MANIDISSIMSKVGQYAQSARGKKVMDEYIHQCRTDGRSMTAAGDIIITEQIMIRAAEAMISMLQEAAARNKLPESVKEHFDSLYYNQPMPFGRESDKYQVEIKFGDDLSRMSLLITHGKNKGQRTGEGIDNIVSLFDTGYDAEKRVYGAWESKGEEIIGSLTHRDGLNFMEEALNDFNREWGSVYNVFAYISSEDPRFYTSSRSFGDGFFL